MIKPRIPSNEKERVAVLHNLLILDTPPEERFDAITTFCQFNFNVDIALISLIDTDRQWFKSTCGINATETSRDISFCGHAINEDDVLIVRDAHKDERFYDNPLVTGEPKIYFYAGAQLKLSSGYVIGTLCLLHSNPVRFGEEEISTLKDLANTVVFEIEKSDDEFNIQPHN